MNSKKINLRKTAENALWIFLISLILFYTIDLKPTAYLAFAVAIFSFFGARYSFKKNLDFYQLVGAMFFVNFLTFVFSKYIHEYRFLGDKEDIACCIYGLLLILGGVVCWIKRRKEKAACTSESETLFRERRFDRDRLREYLSEFPIVGIDAPWGSGKSFVTDQIKDDYITVKIELLTCNLDEIQTVLLNELDKVIKQEHFFSPFSPQMRKLLHQGDFIQNMGQLLVRDDIAYSEAIDGLRKDLQRLKKTVLIIFEDLDRIDNANVIRKVLGIAEKIAGGNVKVIYQYDMENLQEKGLDRRYLEKYIPFTMQLTEISFGRILDYLFESEAGCHPPMERKDFQFLELPVSAPFSVVGSSIAAQFDFIIPNVTVRKAQYFYKEIALFIRKGSIYQKNKREVILYFLLKYFYDALYMQLVPGKSLLDVFLFTYQEKQDTIVNWLRFCKSNNVKISDIFLDEQNCESALMISLFQYECDIYEVERNLESIVNESVQNIVRQNSNEQKDRIIWNLLCNGKSEYTDQKVIVDRLQNEVLNQPPEKQNQLFERLFEDIFHGRCCESEKGDNSTIFRLGVPAMLSLFQACRVAGITGEQWISFIGFYLCHDDVKCITPQLVEYLNYCPLKDRKLYIYILRVFNQLEITGNLNSHKAYRTFLIHYLGAFSGLGYVNTEEVGCIRSTVEEKLDTVFINDVIFSELRKKLVALQQMIPIAEIAKEIDVLIEFLKKNEEVMLAERPWKKPEIGVKSEMHTQFPNQKEVDRLNAMEYDEEELKQKIEELYDQGKITAYEIARLNRFHK